MFLIRVKESYGLIRESLSNALETYLMQLWPIRMPTQNLLMPLLIIEEGVNDSLFVKVILWLLTELLFQKHSTFVSIVPLATFSSLIVFGFVDGVIFC